MVSLYRHGKPLRIAALTARVSWLKSLINPCLVSFIIDAPDCGSSSVDAKKMDRFP